MKDKQDTSLYYTSGLPVPETPAQGEDPGPWQQTDIIGRPIARVDGYARLSGSAVYPSDVRLPGMLYGAILGCPHPHARVKNVDLAKARNMPGVHAVISGDSRDGTVGWDYSQWRPPMEKQSRIFNPLCRFEGDAVAAVAAETPQQAQDALRAISVQYEVLPFVADERDARDKGAPAIHEKGNTLYTDTYTRGDVGKGFADADVVIKQTYRTQCEVHTPMELHGCVANWDGDGLTIWESTQGVYAIQSKVAETLKLPLSKVRIIGHYLGGGFGSKLRAGKYTILAAILARLTARPVKLFLNREQTYLVTGNRPPANMTLKAGATKDGTLTALEFSVLATGGAYPAGGATLVDWQIRDLYRCANVKCTATDVYINAGPARPFRAPGHPQGSWALEQMMDQLAEKLGMDPIAFRLKNIPNYSQARDGDPPYTSTGLAACLNNGAKAFGWEEARKRTAAGRKGTSHIKRGVGAAGSLWIAGGGGPPSTVVVKLFADGSVNLNMGASDIGTGTKTVMALVVAEELGVNPDIIQIENADTGTTQYATPSGGSKTVPTESPATRQAAIRVKQQLLDMAAEELDVDVSELRYVGDRIEVRETPDKSVEITAISGLKKRGVVLGVGHRGPNPEGKVVNPFAAQFCEVEVNTKTGEVQILRFLGAHDSGRVMDRLTFDSQVYGGITMGIGLAMSEFRQLDRNRTGKMVNRNWHDYKLPTSLDVPADMTSLPIEIEDVQANTTGAKGLGEPVTIPTAAAVANAVYDATGIRITETPITPIRLMELMGGTSEEA